MQPILVSYRLIMFDNMVPYFEDVDVYALLNIKEGFKEDVEGEFNRFHTPIWGVKNKIYFQKGIVLSILKRKPMAIFITADFRAVHYWILLMLARVLNIPVFSHGQGLYNKSPPSIIHRILFKITSSLSSSYVCYTESVYKSLIDIGISSSKLSVMDNTIVNNCVVKPKDKRNIIHRLFYVGRLREGCDLKLLFKAMQLLKEQGKEIGLDIVGDGPMRQQLEASAFSSNVDVKFLGAVYDDQLIADISNKCTIGIYPGDAGLSLVHYMSLSLVPIVHDDLTKHMGPEPSYIKNGINGLMFKRGDYHSMAQVIESVLQSDSMAKNLSIAAFDTYCSLSNPTMATKLMAIMKPFIKMES